MGDPISDQQRVPNCVDDPNFATICSFLENFGDACHIGLFPFDRLQKMLEDTNEVAPDLAQIHIVLLRRIYKSINTEKWEKQVTKFCHSYNSQDAWEVERFGYKKSKIQTKLRVLKNLMESQFDYNVKFKNEVNKISADNLRRMPLGRDCEGQVYWYQVDGEANLRIYREDVDDDTWELVATNREEMTELIRQLSSGVVHKNTLEAENGAENGVGESEPSPKEDILRDTGPVSEDGSSDSGDEGGMEIDEDYVEDQKEKIEADIDNQDTVAERMDTKDLGKMVRQLLDKPRDFVGKIPEIKFDVETLPRPPNDTPVIRGSPVRNQADLVEVEAKLPEITSQLAVSVETKSVELIRSSVEESTQQEMEENAMENSKEVAHIDIPSQHIQAEPVSCSASNVQEIKSEQTILRTRLLDSETDASISIPLFASHPVVSTENVPHVPPEKDSRVVKCETVEAILDLKLKNSEEEKKIVTEVPHLMREKPVEENFKTDALRYASSEGETEISKLERSVSPLPDTREANVELPFSQGGLRVDTEIAMEIENVPEPEIKIAKTPSEAQIKTVDAIEKLVVSCVEEEADLSMKSSGKFGELKDMTWLMETEKVMSSLGTSVRNCEDRSEQLHSHTGNEMAEMPPSQTVENADEANFEHIPIEPTCLTSAVEIEKSAVYPALQNSTTKLVPPAQQESHTSASKTEERAASPTAELEPPFAQQEPFTCAVEAQKRAGSPVLEISTAKLEPHSAPQEPYASDIEPEMRVVSPLLEGPTIKLKPPSIQQEPHISTIEVEKRVVSPVLEDQNVELEPPSAQQEQLVSAMEVEGKQLPTMLEHSTAKMEPRLQKDPLTSNIETEKRATSPVLEDPTTELKLPTQQEPRAFAIQVEEKQPPKVLENSTAKTEPLLQEEPVTTDIETEKRAASPVLHGPTTELEPPSTQHAPHISSIEFEKRTVFPVLEGPTAESEPPFSQQDPLVSAMEVEEKQLPTVLEDSTAKMKPILQEAFLTSDIETERRASPVLEDPIAELHLPSQEQEPITSVVEVKERAVSPGLKDPTTEIKAPSSKQEPLASAVEFGKSLEPCLLEVSTQNLEPPLAVFQGSTLSSVEVPNVAEPVGRGPDERTQKLNFAETSTHTKRSKTSRIDSILKAMLASKYNESCVSKEKIQNKEEGLKELDILKNQESSVIITSEDELKLENKTKNEDEGSIQTKVVVDAPLPEFKKENSFEESIPSNLTGKSDSSLSSILEGGTKTQHPVEFLPLSPQSVPVVEEPITKTNAWQTGTSTLPSFLVDSRNVCTSSPTSSDEEIEKEYEHEMQGCLQLVSNEVVIEVDVEHAQLTAISPTCFKEEEKISVEPQKKVSSGLGLVGYAYSSSEDDESEAAPMNEATPSVGADEANGKRRAVSPPPNNPPKCLKLDSPHEPSDTNVVSSDQQPELNPIVGEAIEEDIMVITGEGSGAELLGGNSPETEATTHNDTDQAAPKDAENGNNVEEAGIPIGTKKGPGRPRGRKPGNTGRAGRPKKRDSGGKRGMDSGQDGFSSDSLETPGSIKKRANGRLSAEMPTRQSSRIAKIQEREEEERRRLEEQRLAQLKAAQLKKQQRQMEKEHKASNPSGDEDSAPLKARGKGRPPKTESKYLPTPSSTDSEDEDVQTVQRTNKKRGRKRKHPQPPSTLMKKGLNPWIHTSSEDEDEAAEDEEEEHDLHEEDEEDMTLRSDHEFSPESDMGEDNEEASPSRHARTVKRGETKEDKYADTNCDKCGKGDHPEWILLCDSCDKGYHASCLRPVIWVVPEGQWFCPPCQHQMLIDKLNENSVVYDKLLKRHELEVLRKERLAYVGISLDNVLPNQESENEKKLIKEKKKKHKRQISSDEDELMEKGRADFIDEREDSSNISKYNSEDSEDEPMYKLRARKATKSFNFKEYDELINSALRDEDEYEVVESQPTAAEAEEINCANGEAEVNEPAPPKLLPSKGKVMPGTSDGDEEEKENSEEESEEEEVDEAELKRRKELEKQSHRKSRRRLNDLDATSDDDSDDDFKGSDGDEEEEDEAFVVEDEDSEWSGDREADESDDSIAKRGKKGKFGRQEKFLDVGSVRRSTRRARSKIVYDESDQEDDEDEPAGGWGSEEETEPSSPSESDDETWGKKKKKKGFHNLPPAKIRKSAFLLSNPKPKSKGNPKKKKKKVDEDDTDRAWSKHGGKVKKGDTEASNKRSTRGKNIDFKAILESGESDDDGNIHPKRKKPRLSDYENDSDGPSSSKKLLAELTAARAQTAADAVRKCSTLQANASSVEDAPCKKGVSSTDESGSEEDSKLAELLLKPVPAPPHPPVGKTTVAPSTLPACFPPASPTVTTASDTGSNSVVHDVPPPPPPPPLPISVPSPTPVLPTPLPIVSQPSTNLMMSEILATSGSTKKPTPSPTMNRRLTPPPSSPGLPTPAGGPPGTRPLTPQSTPSQTGNQIIFPGKATPPHRGLSSPPHPAHQLLPPSEISRVPNPAYFPPNQPMRFPWDRNIGPPPPPYQIRGGNPASSIGKSPSLNNSPYPQPAAPPSRPGYVPPPPLRIPNPGGSGPPMQSFQQFKREPPGGPGPQMMYRMPPQGNGGRGGPPPNFLAHIAATNDRLFGPHGGFGGHPPYGLPAQGPMYTTQPQQFDYRRDEDPDFKDEGREPDRRTSSPVGKEDSKSYGEFGGLVSYFSSQRGEEDMDT